ncbi:MAG: insulinase family protein, partial [Bacteroidia bacterium]|nr:insulinase family protein [Bacteroidia bacterium]
MPERKQTPVIVDAVDFNLQLKLYEKFILRNGVEVYTINAGAENVMALEWVFFAGNSFEEQNMVAATTNFLLRNGTSQKTAFQINEYFEYFGAFLNRNCQNETASITLHCLTKHIGELLPVVKELIIDSNMPQDELATYKQNMKQRLKVSLKKSDFIAGRLIDAYLFGKDHPYGRYSTAEAIDSVQREQLIDFYKKYYQQGKLIMFVAGKLHSGLEKLLDDNFGDLPNNSISIPQIAFQPATEKKVRVTNDPAGIQGSVRMAIPFPNRHHPDFVKAQVL